MNTTGCLIAALGMAMALNTATAQTFRVDPSHTFPSFEADHMGLSLWRGRFNKTSGTIVLDRVYQTGTMDITIQAGSIDFGWPKMTEHAMAADMFNVEKFPTIRYVGKSMKFENGKPVSVEGDLTLMGVTRPVPLKINAFNCIDPHPFSKTEVCGADALAEFKRTDFGLDYAIARGFRPEVKVLISVEAVKQQP
jgi:polyisoprenoid-binding protein YceI